MANAASLDPLALLDVDVRMHVELGRARMPLAQAVALADGAIVDLDQEADAPVTVFVNGRPYGEGRLVVLDGEWAVRVETVFDPQPAAAPAPVGERAGAVLADAATQSEASAQLVEQDA